MPNKNSEFPANRLAFIDGLRGLAIFGVIYHHLFSRFTPPGYNALMLSGIEIYPYTILSNGWIGVSLFFFLSGFVLYFPYLTQGRQMQGRKDVVAFYYRRAKRLLPLYYFSILISSMLMYRAYAQPDYFKNMLMLFSFTNIFTMDQYFPKYNWVLWSLGIEIWFSLLFPIVILAIRKLGHNATLILALSLALAVRMIGVDEQYAIKDSPYLNPMKDSVFGRLDDFVIGMYCCYICINNRLNFIRESNSILFMMLGFLVGFTGCILWDLVATGKLTREFAPYIHIVLNISFALIVISLYRMRSFLRIIFTNWPLRVFGMMCFSLYIWHGLVMVALFSSVRWTFTPVSILTYYVFLLILASLSYRYIEFGHVKNAKKLFGLS